MKRYILILAGVLVSSVLGAQQMNISSLYQMNPYEVNPAIAGSTEGLPLAFSFRKAWTGFEETPNNQILSGHMVVADHMGAGVKFFNSMQGPLRRTGMEATYAYHLPVDGDEAKLAFGLSGMFYQYYLDKDYINMKDPDDPVLYGDTRKVVPDAAFGIHYYTDTYFAGISVYQMFQGRVRFDADNVAENQNKRHYFMNMGYSIDVSEEVSIQPSALVKIIETGLFQTDINLRATYMKMVSLGLSYRSGDAMVVQLGYQNDNIVAGYAYDITLSDVRTVSGGSHEIMFIYRFSNFLGK